MKEAYSLERDGIEKVDYGTELKKVVLEAAEHWRKFQKLPENYKQYFATSDTQSGVGYESKSGDGPNSDIKQNFDYARKGDNFDEILIDHPNTTAADFIAAIRVLYDGIDAMARDFAVRHDLPVSGILPFFRFLHYPASRRPGDTIAEPHADHSGYTFHLYEDTSGCQRLTFGNEWLDMPVKDSQAVAFVGMQSQLVSHGELTAVCHRVVANATSAKYGREAIVSFISFDDVPKYDKKTHGRLQEMEPGFNYTQEYDQLGNCLNS